MLHGQRQPRDLRSWTIRLWDRFNTLTGWTRGASINTMLVSIVFLTLFIYQIYLWAKSGSLYGYQIIHSGSCVGNGVGRLNTVLHLVINILSTLVLASTNFFMQVLNAPSREELDQAHEKGSWLDIGVPSPRNAFRVSRFKTTMWFLFFLSSIPIHLLFNSSVSLVDDRGSDFSYFVFDESVLSGSDIFEPGTSLSIPELKPVDWDVYYGHNRNSRTWDNITALEEAREEYFETSYSERSQTINTTVEQIRAGHWHKLDKSNCESLYNTTSCSGLQAYRNIAIILGGSSGWNRSHLWNLPVNESSLWDTYVPKTTNNSLWFAHPANYSRYPCGIKLASESTGGTEWRIYCENSCSNAMGFDTSNSELWQYPLFPDQFINDVTSMVSVRPAPEFEHSHLNVEYCLAEPHETICHIGVASSLLWIVSGCVFLKTVLCFVVVTKLGEKTSLVTPGDVIESFVSHPPDYVVGPCLLEQHALRSSGAGNRHSLVPEPIQWNPKKRRRWHAIRKRIWLSSYFIFSIGIALLVYFFVIAYPRTGWQGSFGQDAGNETISFPGSFRPTFEQAILIANSPQLFLSFAYLAFNSLFTRLHMAKEWAALSTRYKALRVTNPKGQQNSTHFLQLPYRYSVPILIISILLHWMLSGCIYLLLMKGSYLSEFGSRLGPLNSVMAVGFSTKSLCTMMTLSTILVFMPPLFGSLALPSNTVVVGSNSLAIAAACQVSPLVSQNQSHPEVTQRKDISDPQGNDIELHRLMPPSPSLFSHDDRTSESHRDDEEQKSMLVRVSQSKIRWGVVKMPSSWEEQFDRPDISVGHVSFGLPEDDVQQPIGGHWYA